MKSNQSADMERTEFLLERLIGLARDVSHRRYGNPQEIFELTKIGKYPQKISDLAESFGMMMVKIEGREIRLEEKIGELEELNRDLKRQIRERRSVEDMRKKYEFIANSSKEFMTLINRNYQYEAVNDAYCYAHNRDRSDLIGQTVSEVWGNEVFKSVLSRNLKQCFEGNEVRYQEWFNFPALGRRYFDVVYYPYFNRLPAWSADRKKVTHAIVVTRDITDLKRMEERQRELELQLMKEHRLSSIGLLASGIAHNIRSPLTVIMGNAELYKEKYPDGGQMNMIIRQAENIEKILDTMMVKCRAEQTTDTTDIDLNSLLRTELDFLETDHYFKQKIAKNYQFADNLPLVSGVYGDFSQGLINIINNAIDAMCHSIDKILSVRTYYDGNTIYIDIADTGCGIEQENIPKLFNPFFTTKAYHSDKSSAEPKGTGLGLFSSHQILQAYGVLFDVESEINKGTTVHIKIPYDSRQKPYTGSVQ
ncbi:MAG: ATP-binding protein [Candidatus Marinimicrobia bacterium]|nr:ATP-binding protein [Candidatus Neomarinimicrobiota bacterium]